MPFKDDLIRFGPDSRPDLTLAECQAYCANLAATHYENFSVVTRLTPRELRPAFAAVYAFCRWSDDLGDELRDPVRATALLAWWRGELQALYRDEATHPVYRALRPIIATYQIPIEPFEALISAFEQDQRVGEYETYDDLLDYCVRSANPVGHLVLYLGRVFDEENARLSDLTCTGLQLANFWQDVARDLDLGRIYLPREDRDRFGYPETDLRARRSTPAFRELIAFECGRARRLLQEGQELIPRLPRALAIDVDLFHRGGMAILDRIGRQGYDVWSRRPEVSRLAKLGLLIRATAANLGRRRAVAVAAGLVGAEVAG